MNRSFYFIRKGLRVIVHIGEGVCIGGVVGAAASVLTGAVAVTTAPAWIPMVGGAALVTHASVGVASSWAAIGALAGGVIKGGSSLLDS